MRFLRFLCPFQPKKWGSYRKVIGERERLKNVRSCFGRVSFLFIDDGGYILHNVSIMEEVNMITDVFIPCSNYFCLISVHINHYLFACALITVKKISSFYWLFDLSLDLLVGVSLEQVSWYLLLPLLLWFYL